MKKKLIIVFSSILVFVCGNVFAEYGPPEPEPPKVTAKIVNSVDVRQMARRASVQTVFQIPIIKVTFTKPLPEEKKLTEEDVKKLLQEKLDVLEEKMKKVVDEKIEKQNEDIWESSVSPLEVWGYDPISNDQIPLKALVPKGAKIPTRILVVGKVKKQEGIDAWNKEYSKDVLTISETANVSPSKAKEIVSSLRAKGYSINKEVIEESEKIELLWFSDGWDDKYPTTLNWRVALESDERDTNIIIGYDPRGILKIKPIKEDQRVHVVASYFEVKDEFKEKPDEIKRLEEKIKQLEEDKKDLENVLENLLQKQTKEKTKRDISTATWLDVKYGTVKLERFWAVTAASGIFLGNMRTNEKFKGWNWSREWGYYRHANFPKTQAVILTNAHVAALALNYQVYVSEDKEIMWVLYPGIPFIRYTRTSDYYGSPATILSIDQVPVISSDYDCAIMLTSPVPEYEKYKAVLGNSDNVREGQKVLMVGNPAIMQKFSTEGIISNTHYSFLDRLDLDYFLHRIFENQSGDVNIKRMFNWMKNSNFWIDCPIGIGGTSGSGVWALDGPEKGKVIALHNMGLMTGFSSFAVETKGRKFDAYNMDQNKRIKDCRQYKKVFDDFSYRKAIYKILYKDFLKKFPSFKESEPMVAISGMNGAVPISKIKRFLQERGLDPNHFGWEGAIGSYWEK